MSVVYTLKLLDLFEPPQSRPVCLGCSKISLDATEDGGEDREWQPLDEESSALQIHSTEGGKGSIARLREIALCPEAE